MYCGAPGHYIARSGSPIGIWFQALPSAPCPLLPVSLGLQNQVHALAALVDAGADENCIDSSLAHQLGLTNTHMGIYSTMYVATY